MHGRQLEVAIAQGSRADALAAADVKRQRPTLFSLAQIPGKSHDSCVKHPAQDSVSGFPAVVDFGREICCDLASGESREWLFTNGIGGYAFGTVCGHHTRRYHGLLVAALQPPLGRTLLVAKL